MIENKFFTYKINKYLIDNLKIYITNKKRKVMRKSLNYFM